MTRTQTRLAALLAILALGLSPCLAEESLTPSQAAAETPPSPQSADTPSAAAKARELTPEEKEEKEARKACKAKICDIIATRDPAGDDVSCDIVKTWREEDIAKMLGGKIGWPWGKAVCQSKLELARKPLALAMSEAQYEIVMPAQTVRCTLAQKTEGEPYAIEVTMAPKVKFENGKATEATINWGRGHGADARLSADLCRHRARQLGQCARPRGGAHGE
ncbi:MAG: hypothetical protein ACREC3_10760 [Methyloceanibacter sp.]